MRSLKMFFLSLVCLVNIGWLWQQNPKVSEFMQKGYSAWQNGDLSEAMNAYQSALALKPNQTDALNYLGVLYEESGMSQEAEKKYLTAIKVDWHFLPAYSNLGSLYWNQGNIQKAVYYFNKRIKLSKHNDPWVIKAQKTLDNIHNSQLLERQVLISRSVDQLSRQSTPNVSKPKSNNARAVSIERALDRIDR
ncbi:MAG: tetratricopeptide repeat protein [Candidatus Omnitrophota bacterium]